MLVGHACSSVSDATAAGSNSMLCEVSHVIIHQVSWSGRTLLTKVVYLTSLLDRNIAEEFSRLVNKSRLFVSQTCLGQLLLSRSSINIGFLFSCWIWTHGTPHSKSEESSEGEQSDHEQRGIRGQVIGERTCSLTPVKVPGTFFVQTWDLISQATIECC